MRTKIKAGLVILAIAMSVGIAGAYDSGDPWTGTVRWTIPEDTSFTITFAGSETQVDLEAAGETEDLIEPNSQDASAETPIITVENTGNLDLNFTCNLTSAKPSWATIIESDTNLSTEGTEFDTTAVLINASVPMDDSTPMYLWSNVTNAPAGDTTRDLQINSNTA